MGRLIHLPSNDVEGNIQWWFLEEVNTYAKEDFMFNCEVHGEHYDWDCPVCEAEEEVDIIKGGLKELIGSVQLSFVTDKIDMVAVVKKAEEIL